jgi:hypothetical protein
LTASELGHDETSSSAVVLGVRLTASGTAFLPALCQRKIRPVFAEIRKKSHIEVRFKPVFSQIAHKNALLVNFFAYAAVHVLQGQTPSRPVAEPGKASHDR